MNMNPINPIRGMKMAAPSSQRKKRRDETHGKESGKIETKTKTKRKQMNGSARDGTYLIRPLRHAALATTPKHHVTK